MFAEAEAMQQEKWGHDVDGGCYEQLALVRSMVTHMYLIAQDAQEPNRIGENAHDICG